MNDYADVDFEPQVPALFSADEFMRMAGTGVFSAMGRVELAEGVIVRMSPAQSAHMFYKHRLFLKLLEAYRYDDSREVHTELTLRLGAATIREADLGVIAPFGPDADFPDPATVNLIVEIADSSLPEDMGPKLRDYAAAGIPNSWIVDVNARHVHVTSMPLNGDYAERTLRGFGEPILAPGTDRTISVD